MTTHFSGLQKPCLTESSLGIKKSFETAVTPQQSIVIFHCLPFQWYMSFTSTFMWNVPQWAC